MYLNEMLKYVFCKRGDKCLDAVNIEWIYAESGITAISISLVYMPPAKLVRVDLMANAEELC